MSMVKCDDISMPIFDGEDYKHWKKRMSKFLEFKKCKEVITRQKNNTDKEEWNQMEIKAMNYIYSAISNKQLEYVDDIETPYEIILKFDQMYLKESTALQIVHRTTIENIKLEYYPDINCFFDAFEKGINDLKSAGATIKEPEKLNYMLKALPSSYSYLGDLIDVLEEKERTCEYLKQKIKLKDLEGKSMSLKEENSKSNVFMATNQYKPINRERRLCYLCGKPGHTQKFCRGSVNNIRNQNAFQNPRGQNTGSNYGPSISGNFQGQRFQNRRGGFRGRGHAQYKMNVNSSSVFMANFTDQIVSNEVCETEITWILDSGCTDHIINNDKYFYDCITLKNASNVKLGDGRLLQATKIGTVVCNFLVNDKVSTVTIQNVFFVEKMSNNLLSYSKITKNNKIVSEADVSKIYNKKNELVGIANKFNNLYYLKCSLLPNEISVNLFTQNKREKKDIMSLKEKWHRTLGHINFNSLNKVCKSNVVDNLPQNLESNFMKCAICLENKMHNLPFLNNRTKAKEVLEIIHTDLNGPHSIVGSNGERYFLTIVDDFSKLIKIYCIKSKDQVFESLSEYINQVENITNKKVKVIRCDNGKEYINSKISAFIREKGIQIDTCPPYVHELNGTAERLNRTIMDMARCLMAEAKIHRRYWPEAIKTAAFLKNRILANTIQRITPYEIFFNKKPDAKYLRIYGSKIFVRIPEVRRHSKWDKKAECGILVGYSDVGYRVLIGNKVIVARHVDIIEEDTLCIGFDDTHESKSEETSTTTQGSKEEDESQSTKINKEESNLNDHEEQNGDDLDEAIDEQKITNPVRKSKRKPKPKRDENFIYQTVYVNYCNAMNPINYDEAISSVDAKNWKEAMDLEIKNLNKNKTWELVEKPKDKQVIDVKWLYKKKHDGTYKARLVARGFQQKNDIENTYSPVFKAQTLKILLSYCHQNDFLIEQMDVETAFLNGQITSDIYVKQPEGFSNGSSEVFKLYKALYGLKESPRLWYECFHQYMNDLKFVRNNCDYCLYYKITKNVTIYILLYVDDLLICSNNKTNLSDIKQKLSLRFNMKDLGTISNYIGIGIKYDKMRNMLLSQKSYIESLAEKFDIINCNKTYSTPMEVNLKLQKNHCLTDNLKYRNIIGALLYVSTATRPDISFSVNYLSRFQNCYEEIHFKYAMRILKYLYITRNFNLIYTKKSNFKIIDCFVDSDWAGDTNDRKSTTGYIIRLYENPIYWKSHKQKSVTKSSTAAEYVALSEAISEILIMREILKAFKLNLTNPVQVYEDNSGAISITKYGNYTKNAKHIEIQYHFVHENYLAKVIDVIKIKSEDNVADILTKALGKQKFIYLRNLLNLK